MSSEKINFLEEQNFKNIYRSASKTLNENKDILEILIDTYNDERQMTFIKMANDYFEYAPVYSWLIYNKERIKEYCEKKKSDEIDKDIKQAIGAFWAWVMQHDPVNNISIRWRKKYTKQKKQNMRKADTKNFKIATLYICE